MKSNQLPVNEYSDFYKSYIRVLEDVDLIEELEICLHDFIKFVQNIPMEKFDYQYAEGKWTFKEIIQHLIDSERVFSYRALRISRNDKTPLPGFDENDYVANSNGKERTLQSFYQGQYVDYCRRTSIGIPFIPSTIAGNNQTTHNQWNGGEIPTMF